MSGIETQTATPEPTPPNGSNGSAGLAAPAAPSSETADTTERPAGAHAPAVSGGGSIVTKDGEPVKNPAAYIRALEETTQRLATNSSATQQELSELRSAVANMHSMAAENALLRAGVTDPELARRLAKSIGPDENPEQVAEDIAARLKPAVSPSSASPAATPTTSVAAMPPATDVDDLPYDDPIELRRALLRRANGR